MTDPADVPNRDRGIHAASERRAAGYAYLHLRERILSGRLAAGAVLSQAQLAREIGISRTPLREATRRLQQEGLLVGEVNRRLRVAQAPVDELDDLYALRIVAESLAVRITVPKLSDHALDELLDVTDRHAQSEPGTAEREALHREMHMQLVAGAGGQLRSAIESAWDHAERFRRLYQRALQGPDSLDQSEREHRAIVGAVSERDAEQAVEHLARHYARVGLTVLAAHQPEREAVAIRAALVTSRGRELE